MGQYIALSIIYILYGRGRGVLGVYGVEWSWFAGRNLRRFVTLSGERDVGGLCMEEAPGRV